MVIFLFWSLTILLLNDGQNIPEARIYSLVYSIKTASHLSYGQQHTQGCFILAL